MPDATLRDRIIAAVGAAAKHDGIGVSGDGTVSMTTSGWNALHAGLDVVLDTALADAVARARREAFEEAAKALEDRADYFNRSPGYRDWNDAARSYRASAKEVRALAANPPETKPTEMGLKPGAWGDLVGPLVKRCEVAAAFGQEAVWNAKGADALGQILKHMADTLDSLIASDPPPPAIGNLVEEGRSNG